MINEIITTLMVATNAVSTANNVAKSTKLLKAAKFVSKHSLEIAAGTAAAGITTAVYHKGRLDGKKDGYNTASNEYEKKLRKQAENFLNQIKDVRRERDEYEKLLSEYEAYIAELEAKCASAELIREIKGLYDNLKGLRTA